MSLCSSSCNAAVPRFPTGCTFEKRAGGVPNLLFLSCNARFAVAPATSVSVTTPTGSTILVGRITDYTSWAILVQNNMVRLSPEGLGEKPASSFTTQRFASCRPEEISQETHGINFQSFQVDNDNYYDRTYWQNIRQNFTKFRLAWLDCDGILYYTGDPADPGFEFVPTELGYIQPQTNTEKAHYQANLSFNYEGIPAPIEIANLDAALNVDVNT